MPFRHPLLSASLALGILTLFAPIPALAAAPSNLLYPGGNSIAYCPGQALTPATPTVSGTGPITYSIGPGQNSGAGFIFTPTPGSGLTLHGGHVFSLPAGLTFDPATGTIAGTPTAAIAPSNFTVTAMNAQGSVPIALGISVAAACPSLIPPGGPPQFMLTYVTFCKNVPVNGPTLPGLSNLTSVTPALPAGLSISTGEVLGTPTAVTASAAYTFGNGTAISRTQNITVQENCQALILAHHSRVFNICAGNAIDTIRNLATSGGPITQCAIAGLPQGLSMNPVTCDVTGVPAPVLAGNFWTVSGFVSADHGVAYDTSLYAIQSCPLVPSLDYPAADTLCIGEAMEALTPIIGGGAATACNQQGLPQGLTLGPAPACAITGTPAQSVTPGTYPVTVTATIGGSPVPQSLSLILKSCTECVNTWAPHNIGSPPGPVARHFRSIHFNDPVNHNVGHIAGNVGTIRFTDNDGADGWPTQNSGVFTELHAITCAKVKTGYTAGKCYVAGGSGVLKSSLDANTAGATWTSETCTGCNTTTLRSITCPSTCDGCSNPEFCLVVGDGGLIRRKTTAGAWTAPANASANTQQLNGVDCKLRDAMPDAPANYTCYAVGNGGTLLKSTDGGDNWIVNASLGSVLGFSAATNLFSVHFNDAARGWVTGDNGTLLTTSDGAATTGGWNLLNPGTGAAALRAADVRWGASLWAVGGAGATAYSHLPQNYHQLANPYTTFPWGPQTSSPANANTLYGIYATDSCRAWAVGDNETLLEINTCVCNIPVSAERAAPHLRPTARFGLSGEGTLWYELPTRMSVDLELFDARGNKAGSWFARNADAGHRTISQPVRGLRPGTYFLRARMGDGSAKTVQVVFTGK